jgi:flagellar FliL protein
VLVLGAVAALLATGGFVVLRGRKADTHAEEPGGEELFVGETGESERLPEDPGVVALDPFVVNLADPEGGRYMRCTIGLVLEGAARAEELSASDIELTRLRDRIMLVLTNRHAREAASHDGRQELRGALREAIQPLLEGTRVVDVYFTEYLIQ